MKTNKITLENNPELFEDFDDSTIMYISELIIFLMRSSRKLLKRVS